MEFIDRLGLASSSGAKVSESAALTIPTFNACAGLISDMIGMIPCKLYQKTADGREERPEHPAHRLMALEPGCDQTPFEVRKLAQAGVHYGGNGYLRVHRDAFFAPQELEWLKPCDVQPVWMRDGNGRRRAGYKVEGVGKTLNRGDIIHVRDQTTDGITGISPVRLLRESLGLSITQRTQAGKLMANGARFAGILIGPPQVQKETLEDTRVQWAKYQEGSENTGKTPVIKGDWKYQEVQGMTMQDAEFLESRKFERTEIATMFRIPEVLLGNSDKASSWGTGIETLTNGFQTFSLGPWLINWEQSLNYTLLTADERAAGYFFKFTRGALLQLTKEAQAKFFREMRDIGVYSVNDVRRFLDENDLPDHIGDDYRLPFNGSGGTAAKPAGENAPAERTQ